MICFATWWFSFDFAKAMKPWAVGGSTAHWRAQATNRTRHAFPATFVPVPRCHRRVKRGWVSGLLTTDTGAGPKNYFLLVERKYGAAEILLNKYIALMIAQTGTKVQ
jgi:hypothetical protein